MKEEDWGLFDERPDLIGYGEGIRQQEDVDFFTGFGEG